MRGLTQQVAISIDVDPDAHELALKPGDELQLEGSDLMVGETRIGRLPSGISIDASLWQVSVAEVGEAVEYRGKTYPMVRINLVRRSGGAV